MTALAEFNRSNIRMVRSRVLEALKEVEEELGIKITDGDARYSDTTLSIKLEMGLGTGIEGTLAGQTFKRYAGHYGLEPDDLGRKFLCPRGNLYEITGLKTSRPKYPINAVEVATGRSFKFPASAVAPGIIRR